MNDKPKLPSKEEIFDVFRPHGDHDVSAENYLLKKQTQSQAISGPLVTNHFTDANSSPASGKNELHTLNLSGTDEASNAADRAPDSTATTNNDDPQTTIRLETFQIGMHERLASMQVAQQKAKDQLNDLEGQTQGTDKLPKS
jgi:ribosomal protein S10